MDSIEKSIRALYLRAFGEIDREGRLPEGLKYEMFEFVFQDWISKPSHLEFKKQVSSLSIPILRIKQILAREGNSTTLKDDEAESIIARAILDVRSALSRLDEELPVASPTKLVERRVDERIELVVCRSLSLAPPISVSVVALQQSPIEELVSRYPWRDQIVRRGDEDEREFNKLFDGKSLTHLTGDRIAEHSGYEGWGGGQLEILNFLTGLLKGYLGQFSGMKRGTCALVERAIEILEETKFPEEFTVLQKVTTYAAKIRELNLGKTLLIEVGFLNHSVIIEIVCKNRDGVKSIYDLHIYEAAGEGISHSVEQTGQLETKMTRINFLNVSQDLLLIGENGTAWLEFLLGVQKDRTVLDDLDPLFPVAFSHFGKPSVSDSDKRFYRVQQGGTCRWRSLIAWLHFQFDDIEDYKCISTWMGTQTLARCAARFLERDDLPSEDFRILYNCAREMQFHSAMRIEKHVPSIEFDQAAAVSYQVVKECEASRDKVFKAIPSSDSSSLEDAMKGASSGVNSRLFQLICDKEVLTGAIYIPPPEVSAGPLFTDRSISGESFYTNLWRICAQREKVSEASFSEICAHWVLELPPLIEIVKGALGDITKEVAILPLLYDLQKIVGKSQNPLHRLASFKILAITHHIACEISSRKDGGLLKRQKLQDFIGSWLKDRFIPFTELKFLREVEDLKLYFAPYISDDENERLVPLEMVYNPSYFASDHRQAIVRWAYEWYRELSKEDKKIYGYDGPVVNRVIFDFLIKKFQHFDIRDPAYPARLLIQTISLGLKGLFISRKIEERDTFFEGMGQMEHLYLFFRLKDEVVIDSEMESSISKGLQTDDAIVTKFVTTQESFARSDIPSEEQLILSLKHFKGLDDELQRCLVCSASEPLLAPAYIIHHFRGDIGKLADPKLSALWTMAMLKVVYLSDKKSFLNPLAEALLEESFRKQFREFINGAIFHFKKFTEDGIPNHRVCIALMRVALIAANLYKERGQGNLIDEGFDEVTLYLSQDLPLEVPKAEQKMFQILRIYFHGKIGLDTEDTAFEILKAWMVYKSIENEAPKEESALWFQQIGEGVYYQRIDQYIRLLSPESIYRLGKIVFGEVGLELPSGHFFGKVNGVATCLELKSDKAFYRMDLLSGSISTEEGLIGEGQKPRFIKDQSFTKRFPRADSFQIGGPYLYFKVGETLFKVLFGSSVENWEQSLEMNRDGVWSLFVKPDDLIEMMPRTLAQRSLYFIDKRLNLIRGFRREDFRESVVVSAEYVYDKDHDSIVSRIVPSVTLFGGLLSSEYIEIHKQDRDKSLILRAPSLHIWGGNEFCMKFDDEIQRWEHPFHKRFYLNESLSTPSLHRFFGSISQVIIFSHEDGRHIYYLPVTKWSYRENRSALSIELVPNFPKRDLFSTLDGTLYLMEYRDEGFGDLNPASIEAMLYLALIHLRQKNFDLFLHEIKMMDKGALGSKGCQELIQSTVSFLVENHESTLENLASVCHLIVFARSFLIKDNKKWMTDVYIQYLKNFVRIPKELRLTPSDEDQIAIDCGLEWRRAELRDSEAKYEKIVSDATLVLRDEPLTDIDCNGIVIDPMKPGDAICSVGTAVSCEDGSDKKFPEIASALMSPEIGILTESRVKLVNYALTAHTREQLGHLDFYIMIQLNLIYLTSEENSAGRGRRIPFLLLLKAMHHIRLLELFGEPLLLNREVYNRFISHLPYLQGLEGGGEDPFSDKVQKHKQLIKRCLIELCADVAAKLIPKVQVLTPLVTEESRLVIPSTRLNLFEKYKPPTLQLPRPRELPPQMSFSKELALSFRKKLIPFQGVRGPIRSPLCYEEENDGVHAEYRSFCIDLKAGEARLRKRWEVQLSAETDKAMEKTYEEIDRLRGLAGAHERMICECLNALTGPKTLQKLLKRGLGVEPVHTIGDAIYLFFRGSEEQFIKANQTLTKNDIANLMCEIKNYLVLKTEEEHLARIQESYEECKNDNCEGNREKLYKALFSTRAYEPESEPYLLVFEHGMDLRLTAEQVNLIRRMLKGDKTVYQTVAVQFRTGKGKTSVFATLLSMLAANMDGGFGIVIIPKAQMPMVIKSLRRFLKLFNKKLFVFDFTLENLSLDEIKTFLREFKDALYLGNPVISCPESLQLLQLEFLARLDRINAKSLASEIELVQALGELLSIILERGHAIDDEIDLLVDTHKEVNIPSGAVLNLSSEKAFIIEKIYELLLLREDIVRLTLNSQSNMNPQRFRGSIMKEIASDLVLFFDEPALKEPEFSEFLCDEFKRPLSHSQKKFRAAFSDLTIRDRKKGEAIAMAKHILSDILPIVLTKSCGKDYGRTTDKASLKVCPYQGVDTPAENNEFGYHIESGCYHMQTALQTRITKEQIKSFALVMKEKAVKTAERLRSPLLETSEAIKFLEITGVFLSDIQESKSLDHALDKLDREREKGLFKNILALEKVMMQEEILYHTHRLSSGPHSLLGMTASLRVFSAFPWNIETVFSDIEEHYIPDLGGVGEDAATLLSRSTTKDPHIHLIDSVSPVSVISLLLEKGKAINAILDPAGMFKNSNNYNIACQIREVLRANNPKGYTGVLFFTRPLLAQVTTILIPEGGVREKAGEDKSASPDLLAYLSIGSDQLIYLNGTNEAALREKGLLPEKCFIYMGERQTTGTDLAMASDAIGAILIDDTLSYPRFIQAIGRFRKYTSTQDVEIVLSTRTLEKFDIRESLDMSDVIGLSLRALANEKRSIMYPSFCQRVDEVARGEAIKILIKQTATDPIQASYMAQEFRSIIMYDMVDDPIAMFTTVKEISRTRDLIEARFLKRREEFFRIYPGGDKKFFLTKLTSILKEVDKSRFLPKEQMSSPLFLGQTMHQEVQLTMQIQQEEEIEVDLLQIQSMTGTTPFRPSEWCDEDVEPVLKNIRNGKSWEAIKSFSRFFIKPFIDQIDSFSEFSSVIDSDVLCTKNFASVTVEQLPLFHESSKTITTCLLIHYQKSNRFGLRATSEGYKIMLLAEHEALFWKGYLAANACEGVYMIDKCGESFGDRLIDGVPQIDPKLGIVLEKPIVRRLLVQINALAGNVSYLIEHSDATRAWLEDEFESKIKLIRFAVLSRRKLSEQKLLESHHLFLREVVPPSESSRVIRDDLSDRGVIIRSLSPEQVTEIDPEDVYLLPTKMVRYLIKTDQVGALPPTLFESIVSIQADLIKPEQVELVENPSIIQAITRLDLLCELNPDQLEYLTEDQVRLLKDYPDVIDKFEEVAAKKLATVAPEKVSFLSSRLAIQAILAPEVINQLHPHQLPYLTRFQKKHLINPDLIKCIHDKKSINELNLDKVYQFLTEEQILLISSDSYLKMAREMRDYELMKKIIVSDRFKEIYLSTEILETFGNIALRCLVEEYPQFAKSSEFLNLSKAKFLSMTDPILAKVPKEKIAYIVGSLDQSEIPHIRPNTINSMLGERVRRGEYGLLEYMTDRQLFSMEKDLLVHLSPKRRSEITEFYLIDLIKDEGLDPLTDEELLSLSDESISALSPRRIHEIENRELIRRLSIDQCMHLQEDMIKKLSVDQITQMAERHARLIPYLSDIMPLMISKIIPGQLWPLEYFSDQQLLLIKANSRMLEISDKRIAAVRDPELISILRSLGKLSKM